MRPSPPGRWWRRPDTLSGGTRNDILKGGGDTVFGGDLFIYDGRGRDRILDYGYADYLLLEAEGIDSYDDLIVHDRARGLSTGPYTHLTLPTILRVAR